MDELAWVQGFLGERIAGPMGAHIDVWVAEMETDGRSKWTLYQYKRELQRLVALFPEHAAADYSKLDVQTFKMERARGAKPATLRRSLVAVRSFFAWAEDNDLVAQNPCRRVSLPVIPDHEPSFWTAEEVRRLLQVDGLGARDRLLLNLLARSGQRLTPTRTLTWDRVRLDATQPHIRFGRAKGGKYHAVPIDRTLYRLLKSYRELVAPEPDDYVFRSRQRTAGGGQRPIGSTQCYRVITEACRRAGVRVATAHEFRRSLATQLLSDPNVPFKVVSKDVLNHANPVTTLKHYAGGDFDQVAAALRDVW